MADRNKPPEIYVSHFKTTIDLVALLNSHTRLANRVRAFIDKLRRVPGRHREPILVGSTESLNLDAALLAAEAELSRYRWTVTLDLEWGRHEGRMWSIRPNLRSEYQTWIWAVLDYDRSGVINQISDCTVCGKTFIRRPRGNRRGNLKYCGKKCAQKAHRSPESYKQRKRAGNRKYMRRRRSEEALSIVTHDRWDHLKSAGYTYLRATTCWCGANLEWWRPPRRRTNARGRPPKVQDLPLEKVLLKPPVVRIHWPHRNKISKTKGE